MQNNAMHDSKIDKELSMKVLLQIERIKVEDKHKDY